MEMRQNKKSPWFNLIKVQSGAEALAAASFSVAVAALVAWTVSGFYYGKWPEYREFTAGGTIYNGYNKQGDMAVFYLLIVLVPLLYMLFLYVYHKIALNYVNLKKKFPSTVSQEITNKYQIFSERVSVLLLSAYALIAMETAISGRFIQYKNQLAARRNLAVICLLAVMLLTMVVSHIKKKEIAGLLQKISYVSQILLPFAFLGYFGFYYSYESEEGLIELYGSLRWKYFCVLLFLIFLVGQIYCMWKKKCQVSVFSIITIGTMTVLKTPEGILSVDFFHNGEMAMPMQQLVSYNKLPYFHLDPIHGLCDYLYSFFNYLFFDGSYFAQNAAIVVTWMWIGALISAILWLCLKNKSHALLLVWLFMPYLAQKADVRYVFFLLAFLILLSDKVRKNSFYFLWWWIFLCMVGILYNVSIGSSMAVAFLPEVLYRLKIDIWPFIKNYKETFKKQQKALLLAYGILFIAGICYIPWFLEILRFLKENAGTTLWANGTAIFGDEYKPVETFGILVPYLCCLTVAASNNKKGKFTFLSMMCGLLVICNYACVRYDEGLRLAVLSVLFCFLMLAYFLEDFLVSRTKAVFLVIMISLCGFLMKDYLPIRQGPLLAVKNIPAVKEVEIQKETIQDPVVFVSGDSVQMDNLGTGFIQGLTLNSLKNVQTVIEKEQAQDSYLDLTNKISHYVIFDLESEYPFSSAYNISNGVLQNKAIKLIETKKPHLILLSPYIRFDEAPIGLRSPKLYHKLMELGYEPYVYEDVIYLLDRESQFDLAIEGKRRLGQLNHRTKLGMLPYLWGTALSYEKDNLQEIFPKKDQLNGSETDYLELVVDSSKLSTEEFTISFKSMIDSENYQFQIETGLERLKEKQGDIHYLIPLLSSPFFTYSDEVLLQIDGLEIKEKHYYKLKQ